MGQAGRRKFVWVVCIALVATGAVLSGYLSYRTIAIASDSLEGKFDACSALFSSSCDETLDSASSWLMGIPLAGWGLMYFAAVGTLLALVFALREAFERVALVAILVMNVGAVGAGAWLSAQFLGDTPFCPLCMAVHVINLILLLAFWILYGCTFKDLTHDLEQGFAYLMGAKVKDPTHATWRVSGFVMAALVAVIVFQWLMIRAESGAEHEEEMSPEVAGIIDRFHDTAPVEVPVDESDPRLGPADAPVEIIIFSSMQCPACRSVAQLLDRVVEMNEGEVSVVFKHFPLGDCNPLLGDRDMQPMACEMAEAAVAAHTQGKFWAFHDAVFGGDLDHTMESMHGIAEAIGLDLDKFDVDRQSAETKVKVLRDAELGLSLDISQTPTVYMNGRRVPSDGLGLLGVLIERELDHSH